ncbi:MAG TPA: hypothetical protein VH331_17485 [Allosphingosinicella sp.]|jgi:hypothetical protein|nr:hypothetical protein [Allosphingosinicella sp.]
MDVADYTYGAATPGMGGDEQLILRDHAPFHVDVAGSRLADDMQDDGRTRSTGASR